MVAYTSRQPKTWSKGTAGAFQISRPLRVNIRLPPYPAPAGEVKLRSGHLGLPVTLDATKRRGDEGDAPIGFLLKSTAGGARAWNQPKPVNPMPVRAIFLEAVSNGGLEAGDRRPCRYAG